MDWNKLQNGSDIRGVAIDGVEGESVNLTLEVVEVLGKAFVTWLRLTSKKNDVSVAVGTDSRVTGPALKTAFMNGMTGMGAKVFDCGLASTPAMFMTMVTGENPCTGGVMITASHLPFNRNGLKFFTREGGLDKKDITEILRLAALREFDEIIAGSEIQSWNFIDEYARFLVDYIRNKANIPGHFEKPLEGLKIIVDAEMVPEGFLHAKYSSL